MTEKQDYVANQLKQATERFVLKETKSLIEHFGKRIKKVCQELWATSNNLTLFYWLIK